jgi:uncharacterized membrane protein YhaH (DUF805 family)
MKWYLKVWKKYAVFSGRASRTEYWMFFLFNIIAAITLGLIEVVLGSATDTDQSVLVNIYQLAVLIPSLAVGWRRMHDTDRSGWWLIVPIVSLIFSVGEGTKGDNKFGPDPWGNSQS